MPRIQNVAVPLVLLLSALALSGCASEPKVAPVAAPAPVEVVAQVEAPAPAPVVAPAPAPAPVVATAPAPQPVVVPPKKKAFKRKPAPAKVAPPAPAPVPVAEPVAPPPVAPPKPAPVPPPATEVAEAGFLEQYWLWLLILGIVIVGIVAWWKSRENK